MKPCLFRNAHAAILLCLIFAFAPRLSAQTAEISGRVSDPSDAVVPEVQVAITNVDTGVRREAATNDSGYYLLPLLPPGNYQININKQGFKPLTRSGVRLDVGQAARMDFTLEIGSSAETVQVTGEAPLVSLSDATVGKVIDSARITNLPLNGRKRAVSGYADSERAFPCDFAQRLLRSRRHAGGVQRKWRAVRCEQHHARWHNQCQLALRGCKREPNRRCHRRVQGAKWGYVG